jgi:hypothetical protein
MDECEQARAQLMRISTGLTCALQIEIASLTRLTIQITLIRVIEIERQLACCP